MKRCDTSMSNPPGRDRAGGLRCTCGAVVSADSFRDRISYREHARSGWCQACQDDYFFRASRDARQRYPIRRGVLAAPAVHDGAVVELALLPFHLHRPRGPGRVGGAIPAPRGRRARAARARLMSSARCSLRSPPTRCGSPRSTMCAAPRCVPPSTRTSPSCATPRRAMRSPGSRSRTRRICLALVDDLPWRALFGETLPPPCASPGAGGVSVLRACAGIAVALAGRPRGTFEPLRRLLRAHRRRFPELDGASSDAC